MKRNKFLACLLAGALAAVSLTACNKGNTEDPSTKAPEVTTEAPTQAPTVEPTTEAPQPTKPEASVDFEDGLFGFVAPYMAMANSAELGLDVVDFNGSKALQVSNVSQKVIYLGIDVSSLCGSKAADVAKVEMTLGVSYEDGTFNACAGNLVTWTGEELTQTSYDWSVYMASKNPKVANFDVSAVPFTSGNNNIMVLTLTTDNGLSDGHGVATLYVDDIRFLDKSGNLISADTKVAFEAPAGYEDSGKDYSNLCLLQNPVNFEGFATSAGGWAQAGFTMPEEVLAALVPGAVVEIEYSSENGDLWIVMNEAQAGWMRVGQPGGAGTPAYYNTAKNICQITYEQLAALCSDDVSTWGSTMQCEASGAWEVFSVKVGQKAPNYALTNAVEFEGFATSAGAWSQAGFTMPEEILAALVPGAVVEITYSSENGDMWIVMNEAQAGWMRVGQPGGAGTPGVTTGEKCYITYEQIAELCSDDVSTWGSTMQCEASGAWEVYSVKVGTAESFAMCNNLVKFEGFETSAGGWAQAGFTMPEEIIAALVPGSVVTIQYSSENGDMWIVMNEAQAGWMRVGQPGGAGTPGLTNGSFCQITYEQLAELCGDDVSTWGSTMQCEASGAWEVYNVWVGSQAVAE